MLLTPRSGGAQNSQIDAFFEVPGPCCDYRRVTHNAMSRVEFSGLFEIAHTAANVANSAHEADFGRGIGLARARKHVSTRLGDLVLLRGIVDHGAKHLAAFILQCSYVRAKCDDIGICACKDFSIADVEAKWLQVTVLETTLALV